MNVVKKVVDIAQGNVGEILSGFRKLLDAACDDKSIEFVDDEEFVSKILKA